MAFGEKFNLDFVDLIRKNTWEIKIFEEGYVGGISSVTGTGEPLIINWLETFLFDPIGASECVVELQSKVNFEFKDFLSAIPNQFLINIKKNGSLYWEGVNVTENNNEPYDDTPYNTSLKFTDGLGQLKFTEFEDGGLIDGSVPIIDIITFCLNKLPYQLNVVEVINILEDNIFAPSATDSFLNKTFLDRAVFRNFNTSTKEFEGWNCLSVIQNVLHSIGATIFQSSGKWFIVRIEEYEASSVTFIEYLAGTTNIDSNGSLPIRVTIDNDSLTGISWINRNADLNVSKVFDEIEYIYKFGSPDQDPGELISDANFELSFTQLNDIEAFDLFEIGSGYTPGLSPRKFFATANDFYYLEDTFGMFYDTPSMQINPVFDPTKFLRSLEYANADHTRENLVTTVNDNAVINFNGWLFMQLGAYTLDGFDQTDQLNIPYEITFFISVQIGTFYLEEDSDGVLSWANDANAVISIRKLFDLKKPEFSWRGGVGGSNPTIASLDLVFRFGPIAIELPNFPENALNFFDVKLFQPATPIIFPILNNVTSAIQSITIQLSPLSVKYQPNNGQLLTAITASRFNTDVKDRKKIVTVLFGDGPHSVIKNSFLVFSGFILEASDNWIKASGGINTFLVDSITSTLAGKARYIGLTDHDFVVGQYIQGDDTFTKSSYKVFQKITQIVSSKIIITDAQFTGNDTGTLFERNSAAETFILGPYGKYFSVYRDDLRGDLTGNFEFFNSFLGDNDKLYFQRGASYRIKSNEVTVQLIELNDDPTITTNTNQYSGISPKPTSETGNNTETNTPNTDAESATGNTGHQQETNTQNMNVSIKSSQVIQINGTKHNPDNFRNYPAD